MLPTLVLLHGSNGSHKEILPLVEALRPHAKLLTPDYIGHGGRPLPERITVAGIAADLVHMLDEKGIDRAFFFGYSFGGYVALYLARHFPERVRGVCTLATKVALDTNTIGQWVHSLDPARMVRVPGLFGGTRAEELARVHHPQEWQQVVLANRAMFASLGERPEIAGGDLEAIRVPVLVMSGAQDRVVSAQETQGIANALRAKTFLFRGDAHPVSAVPAGRVARVAGFWMAGVAAGQDYARIPAQDLAAQRQTSSLAGH